MKKSTWYVIGLMSGTSLDGVDLAYIRFEKNDQMQFKLLHTQTIPYSLAWKKRLKEAYYFNAPEIAQLDADYGRFLGSLVHEFTQQFQIQQIDFIASHGHTIFHQPGEGYTLQIGNGAHLAAICHKKVVCDFRTQDVALGGQGAPLVPIGDRILFSAYDFCVNIGGFANISYENDGERRAFDICPANIVLNHYAQQLGRDFDERGKMAAEGLFHQELFDNLQNLPFYKTKNSMGFEMVLGEVFPLIDRFHLNAYSVLNTFTEHIATKISSLFTPQSNVLMTGGGVFNTYLIDRIKFHTQAVIKIPDPQIINFKEALIFGLLGLLRVENEVNCLSSVTGAIKNHSSGQIYNP